jgi:hypothetical protein
MVFGAGPYKRQAAEVVTVTNDDHPALVSALERELEVEKANAIAGLTSAKDWPDFQKRRGTIEGLSAAISICQQVQKKLS